MERGRRSTHSRHTPGMRGIQYAAAFRFHRWRFGLLDRPPSRAMTVSRRPASSPLPRDLLDAGDQFVDGLVDRHLLAHHAVHGLGPDVLVVQDGELVVLGEVERYRAAGELGIDRLAMAVGLPERALLPR